MRSFSLRSPGSLLLLIGVVFAAACSHGARRTMPSGSGGSGNPGTAGSLGSGGSFAVDTDPPAMIIPGPRARAARR